MYTVSLVVADHVVNTAGSSIPVTAILEGATGFSTNSTAFIDVQISGIETPVLEFKFWMEQFNYNEKTSGYVIYPYLHSYPYFLSIVKPH